MFHVGGARSALQNWIFAQQQGGVFVLRIEDTDAARNRPEWTEGIISALDWIGIERGGYEGPYMQSAYAAEHTAAATRLYADGKAYYCGCTREDVIARTGNKHTGYDGFCRDRGLGPGEGRALRFQTPDEGETVVIDLVRGVGRLEVGALVGTAFDADPVEGRDDALDPLGTVAGRVGVLDAEDEGAAGLLGDDPVVQRRAGATDVEHSGRRRGEAYAYCHATSVRRFSSRF